MAVVPSWLYLEDSPLEYAVGAGDDVKAAACKRKSAEKEGEA